MNEWFQVFRSFLGFERLQTSSQDCHPFPSDSKRYLAPSIKESHLGLPGLDELRFLFAALTTPATTTTGMFFFAACCFEVILQERLCSETARHKPSSLT